MVLPHGPANSLCPLNSSVICASHQAYILDPESEGSPPTFNASTNAVHTIVNSAPKTRHGTTFLTAAENDHFINVFNAESPTLIGSLRTENEILSLDLYSKTEGSNKADDVADLSVRMLRPQQALAAVNKDGVLEIFPEPFEFGSSPSEKGADNLKARMRQRTRKAAAQVRIHRPDKSSTSVPLINASFQKSYIVMAWAEGGANLDFDTVQWRDAVTGNLLLKEVTEIIKAKNGTGVEAVVMNGIKDMGRTHVDESHAVVANGGDADDVPMEDGQPEVIDISSGEEDSEFEEDGPPARVAKAGGKEGEEGRGENGANSDEADVEMEDVDRERDVEAQDEVAGEEVEETGEAEEPSFGDLIRANAPEPVDIQASFTDQNAQSLVPTGERGLQQLPPGMSLGTVLNQSLRTNDTNLLETCFHVRDLNTVRTTIERLESSFATILLQRLAERLHSRPGRAGSLMVWIQWTLVSHGGYLAGQPEVMQKLASLHRVVKDRANSLQSLLALKGKLDMLEAQMNLRKSMQARSKAANSDQQDDEKGVIYVEGQDESDSDAAQGEENTGIGSRPAKAGAKSPDAQDEEDNEESGGDVASGQEDSEEEMPTTTNKIFADAKDEDSESDEEKLFDDEASSTDHDSIDEASDDDVDHDSVDIDSSDADTTPPPKRPAKSKLSNGLGSRKR